MDKLTEIRKYSDPAEVAKIGKKLKLQIYVSTRKDKKYMVKIGGETIHFGAMGYEDFTKTHDIQKRKNFQTRNARWMKADKFTPAWLAYHILW